MATTRLEERLGLAVGVGTTYTIVGAAVPASTRYNFQLHLVNVAATAIRVQAFIADTSWTTGEPATTTLKWRLCYNALIAVGGRIDLSGQIALTTEKIVVRSDTAASLDACADGVKIT